MSSPNLEQGEGDLSDPDNGIIVLMCFLVLQATLRSPCHCLHERLPQKLKYYVSSMVTVTLGKASILDKLKCGTHQMSRRLLLSSKKALT